MATKEIALLNRWALDDPDICRIDANAIWVREPHHASWQIISPQFIEWEWRIVLANVLASCAKCDWGILISAWNGRYQADLKVVGDFSTISAGSQWEDSIAIAALSAYLAAIHTIKNEHEISLEIKSGTAEQITPKSDQKRSVPQAKIYQLAARRSNPIIPTLGE